MGIWPNLNVSCSVLELLSSLSLWGIVPYCILFLSRASSYACVHNCVCVLWETLEGAVSTV